MAQAPPVTLIFPGKISASIGRAGQNERSSVQSVSMTLALAIIGTVLGILNLLWGAWTWCGSNSRVQIDVSFRIFPGLARKQILESLAQAQLPPELADAAQQMIQYHAQIPISTDLSYPLTEELMAALPPDKVMIVAAITNTGRLPVTIQRCQWRTSQPGFVEVPDMPPGVSFPYRLGENDRCISVITLATIMAVLDAPLRDKTMTGREAWPVVEVANLRKPRRGNSLAIPTRDRPPAEQRTTS
jgi:hypothetical protein